MPQNISCLLAFALVVGSALVATPSQAQTSTKTTGDTTASPQSSVTNVSETSNLDNSTNLNQNKTTNISQSQPEESSINDNTIKPKRERNWLYSRIGFGLKQ